MLAAVRECGRELPGTLAEARHCIQIEMPLPIGGGGEPELVSGCGCVRGNHGYRCVRVCGDGTFGRGQCVNACGDRYPAARQNELERDGTTKFKVSHGIRTGAAGLVAPADWIHEAVETELAT